MLGYSQEGDGDGGACEAKEDDGFASYPTALSACLVPDERGSSLRQGGPVVHRERLNQGKTALDEARVKADLVRIIGDTELLDHLVDKGEDDLNQYQQTRSKTDKKDTPVYATESQLDAIFIVGPLTRLGQTHTHERSDLGKRQGGGARR